MSLTTPRVSAVMLWWIRAHRSWSCRALGNKDSEKTTQIEMETATQEKIKGEVCGPVRIQIEGFRPIHTEVSFVDMKPQDGEYEPLIGYLVLEQSQAAVDILGHRLVPIKHMDLKLVSVPLVTSARRQEPQLRG